MVYLNEPYRVIEAEQEMSGLKQSELWSALASHYNEIKHVHMRDMFDQEENRFEKYSLKLNDILYDYSKNRINDETLKLLLRLTDEADLSGWIEKMFTGAPINNTEHRAVLHVALRDQNNQPVMVDGHDILPEIRQERERVKLLAENIRTRKWRGATNQAITDVVNIGIGGSHLGPLMVTEALRPHTLRDLNVHFVSNIDENHINDTLEYLNPETTFFIISSKTFTTQDTMVNADTARQWYLNKIGDDECIDRHFSAVTSNVKLAKEFGIAEDNIFKMWDWIGGRYSLWSAIGLSIVIAIGSEMLMNYWKAPMKSTNISGTRHLKKIYR